MMIDPDFVTSWLPWLGGIIAFLGTAFLTPAVIRLAHHRGWVAVPRKDRWHERPTALMGGIALYGGASVAMALLIGPAFPWAIWLGATVMFVTGLVDDLKTIKPGGKLIAQVSAAVILVYGGYSFGQDFPVWIALPVTFLWVIGITNAINLLDNMDGLAAGIAGIAAAVLALFSSSQGDMEGFALGMAVAGACGGFLLFNFKPARIFMGDSGSLFLGFAVSALALKIQPASSEHSLGVYLVSIAVLAIPIFDTTLVTLVRKLSGRAISQGGRDHSSHRLVFLGLSERNAVLTLYAISLVFGVAALLFQFADIRFFYALLLVLGVALSVFGVYLASVDVYRTHEDLGFFTTRAYVMNGRFFTVLHSIFGRNWKASFGVLADIMLIAAAYILAHYLRFEDGLGAAQKSLLIQGLPAVVLAKILVFYGMGLYKSIWRHAGTPEFVRILKATTLAAVVTYGILGAIIGLSTVSIAIVMIDWMAITLMIAGARFGFRGLRQYIASKRQSGKRVLLYGAGDAGLLTLRELRQNPELDLAPIGFIDDDPLKHGMTAQGIPVLGSFRDLERIIRDRSPEAVLITAFRITDARKAEICAECKRLGVQCQVFQLGFTTLPFHQSEPPVLQAEAGEPVQE